MTRSTGASGLQLWTVLAILAFTSLHTNVSSGQTSPGLYVVLNVRNPTRSLSRSQIRNMFTGVQAFWNGTVPVQLFTRPGTNEACRGFFDQVIEMSAPRFEAMWTSRQLAGQGVAPVSVVSAVDVAARIARTPGGIGLIAEVERALIPSGQVKLLPIP